MRTYVVRQIDQIRRRALALEHEERASWVPRIRMAKLHHHITLHLADLDDVTVSPCDPLRDVFRDSTVEGLRIGSGDLPVRRADLQHIAQRLEQDITLRRERNRDEAGDMVCLSGLRLRRGHWLCDSRRGPAASASGVKRNAPDSSGRAPPDLCPSDR